MDEFTRDELVAIRQALLLRQAVQANNVPINSRDQGAYDEPRWTTILTQKVDSLIRAYDRVNYNGGI